MQTKLPMWAPPSWCKQVGVAEEHEHTLQRCGDRARGDDDEGGFLPVSETADARVLPTDCGYRHSPPDRQGEQACNGSLFTAAGDEHDPG